MTPDVGTLPGIDPDGLQALAAKADAAGASPRTLSARTVCTGAFLNHTYVRDLEPMAVDEPPSLLGTDTAPNPSEAVLAALGSCLSVGIVANATARGIRLEEVVLELEADLDTAAVWGVAENPGAIVPGFSAVRVRAALKGDATTAQLDELQAHALRWSPVGNTIGRPVTITSELVTQ
jgi:uncharacterized OsmC-like protein